MKLTQSARPFTVLLSFAVTAVGCSSEVVTPSDGDEHGGSSVVSKGGSAGEDQGSSQGGGGSKAGTGGSKAGTGGSDNEGAGGGKAGTGGSKTGAGGNKTGTGGSKVDGGGGKTGGAGGKAQGTGGSTTGGGGKVEGTGGAGGIPGGGGTPVTKDTKEDEFAECKPPTMPGMNELKSIAKLPDPFTFKFGDGKTIAKKEEWTCRRAEINAAAQKYIYGEKPVPEKVSATYSGGKLDVTVTDKGKSISFSISISGGDPSKPKPLLLEYGGGTSFQGDLIGVPTDVVKVGFPDGTFAADGKTRTGKFYDLYGSSHPGGELIAWAWGVSRIIDALELAPEAGIDPTKVAVHGCSRYGKGALAAGAFDKRVALTIPEEGGSGGAPAWRMIAKDSAAQPLSSACTECVWFHKDFCSFDGKQDKLPVDMHEIMGMVAPRGLLYLDQPSADWLGKSTGYWSANATAEIYKALGEQGAFTYSQMNGSGHCQTPSGQSKIIGEYVNYYLLGKGSKPAGAVNKSAAAAFDAKQWIDWTTPTLQ